MRRIIALAPIFLLLLAFPAVSVGAKQKTASLKTVPSSKLNGQTGFGRVLKVPPTRTAKQYSNLRKRFATVNPSTPRIKTKPAAGPFGKPTQSADNYPVLNNQGATRPLWGSGAAAGVSNTLARAATSSVLVSTPVADGFDSLGNPFTSQVGEPSIAGVPGALLYTGNWHAGLSSNDGLSWSYLDPENMFPESAGTGSSDNGLCCDQVVLSERSTSSSALTIWLGQSSNVSGADGNRLRLLVFEGPSELLEQRSYCSIDLTPQGVGYDSSTMYDFNQMARTEEWLYVTTNVYDLAADLTKTSREARIYRVKWDDLKDGDCSPQVQSVVPADGYSMSPTQGADEKSTMYFATPGNLTNGDTDLGDGLLVYKAKDSENSLSDFVVNTKNWPTADRGDLSCSLPDGSDACARSDDRITTGWRVDSRAGWLWNVPQGSGYDYPHIQGAVINTDTEELAFEQTIYNNDYAWIYPSVQVNSSEQVGLTAYKAGGGYYTRARSFLIKSPKSSSSWSGLQSQGIVSSTHGVSEDKWGDYATLSAYPGCSKTFAAAVWSMQGGDDDGDSQHRFAWFGETGCPNLTVEKTVFLPPTVERGEDLAVGVTTRNSGSASASSSRGYVYLSSDTTKSSGDDYLGYVSQPSLAAGVNQAKSDTFTVPSGTGAGSYYLIACADGSSSVTETSENDNCRASEALVSVTRPKATLTAGIFKVNITQMAASSGANRPQIKAAVITRDLPALTKLKPVFETYLSLKPVFSTRAMMILRRYPRPPIPPPVPHSAQADQNDPNQDGPSDGKLPDGSTLIPIDDATLNLSKFKPGRYFVFACLRKASQKIQASNCVGVGSVNRTGFVASPQRSQ